MIKFERLNIIEGKIEILSMMAKTETQKAKLRLFSERVQIIKRHSVLKNMCAFSEKTFQPWRELKEIEKKVNFKFLNDSFNDLQAGIEAAISEVANEDAEKNIKKIEGKLKAGDIAAIAAMSFISYPKLYAIIADFIKRAFEIGKKTSSDEIDVERPVTPTQKTQLNNFTAAQVTEGVINDIDSAAKESAKQGLSKGIAASIIAATVNTIVRDKIKDFVKSKAGDIVSDAVNDGRRLVFDKNIPKIQGYIRSEILDDRTCNICLSLDGRQVKPNDPMYQLDQVHTNCRGVWIPILVDEEPESEWGIPKKIRNAFNTENRFGIPVKNNFKQIK